MKMESDEIAVSLTASLPPEHSGSATLRLAALAERFDVCPKTIGRHVDKGLLPQPDFYVGRFPHWKVANIEHWIETKKRV